MSSLDVDRQEANGLPSTRGTCVYDLSRPAIMIRKVIKFQVYGQASPQLISVEKRNRLLLALIAFLSFFHGALRPHKPYSLSGTGEGKGGGVRGVGGRVPVSSSSQRSDP